MQTRRANARAAGKIEKARELSQLIKQRQLELNEVLGTHPPPSQPPHAQSRGVPEVHRPNLSNINRGPHAEHDKQEGKEGRMLLVVPVPETPLAVQGKALAVVLRCRNLLRAELRKKKNKINKAGIQEGHEKNENKEEEEEEEEELKKVVDDCIGRLHHLVVAEGLHGEEGEPGISSLSSPHAFDRMVVTHFLARIRDVRGELEGTDRTQVNDLRGLLFDICDEVRSSLRAMGVRVVD